MLRWVRPNISFIRDYMNGCNEFIGSDTSKVNVFITGCENNCLVAEKDGVILRYYSCPNESRNGYGFPLYCNTQDLKEYINIILEDARENYRPMKFCMLDNAQAEMLMEALDGYNLKLSINNDDADYIHRVSTFSDMSGGNNRSRRNLLNRFYKMYPFAYESLSADNLEDAMYVAHMWLDEKPDDEYSQMRSEEIDRIARVLRNFDILGLLGGVVLVDDEPVAMTIASRINNRCIDVHFEKSFGQFAKNGAYPVLEHFFANSLGDDSLLLNWEEDMGIAFIRLAKELSHANKHYKFCASLE